MTKTSGRRRHPVTLTRREREIMDILYRRARATAGEVMAELTGDPSYSTVRTQLRVLEDKGHVHHEELGLRYVYMPAVPRHAARKSGGRRPARRPSHATVRRGPGSDCRSRHESQKGRRAMIKISLIVLCGLA